MWYIQKHGYIHFKERHRNFEDSSTTKPQNYPCQLQSEYQIEGLFGVHFIYAFMPLTGDFASSDEKPDGVFNNCMQIFDFLGFLH